MSWELFQQALVVLNVAPRENEWVAQWVDYHAADARVERRIGCDDLRPVEFALVMAFLQRLRDVHLQRLPPPRQELTLACPTLRESSGLGGVPHRRRSLRNPVADKTES
jgi:hypothetical protein